MLLGPATLRLNPALATSDLAEFRASLARADAEAAVALYAGPFLEGFLIRGADPFERWAAAERAELAAQHARALETLAERAAARGDAWGAAEWWRRLQAADPLSGRVAAGLMRALDAAGDRAGALRHARLHEALLQQEIGPAAADPVVAALAAELAHARPAEPVVTAAAAAGRAPPAAAPADAGAAPAHLPPPARPSTGVAGSAARRRIWRPSASPRRSPRWTATRAGRGCSHGWDSPRELRGASGGARPTPPRRRSGRPPAPRAPPCAPPAPP